MPFIPLPVMVTDTKKKKMKLKKPFKPKGWRLQRVRHSNARRFGKAGGYYKKKHKIKRNRFQKFFFKHKKFFDKTIKAHEISTAYQEKIWKGYEKSYIARGMWGLGAFGGGALGLGTGIIAFPYAPQLAIGGLLTGGMAGGTLALTAYKHLPERVKKVGQVDVAKEEYGLEHTRLFAALIPVTEKQEKKIDEWFEKHHLPYEKQMETFADKAFEILAYPLIKASEKSGKNWEEEEKKYEERMRKYKKKHKV